MPLLGAHMSIAGGIHKAVDAAAALGMKSVQVFTHSPSRWAVPPVAVSKKARARNKSTSPPRRAFSDEDVRLFQASLHEASIRTPLAHDSYLINLASPDAELWMRSIDAFVHELLRCETLGIPYLVTHPGAHMGTGEPAGLQRVADALDEVHRQTTGLRAVTLLETTAGQGTCLGHRFEHLAAILNAVHEPDRVAVCLDTCHLFAAGYAMSTLPQYRSTMRQLNRTVGIARVKAVHLNDSKGEFGSRVDRHDHIGRGRMGLEPFRHLLNDRRFRQTPMCLETPKGTERGVNLDLSNLNTLRGLLKQSSD